MQNKEKKHDKQSNAVRFLQLRETLGITFSVQTMAVTEDSICCEEYSPDVFSLSKDLSLKVKCISEAKFLGLQITSVFVVGTEKQLDIVEKAVEREINFKIERPVDKILEFTAK